MLAVRVIPCLDVDAGRVVKGVRFVEIRDAGDPVELAARYDAEGADELVFLDITASSDDRDTMVHVVERVADQVFIPFTVGGGIRSVEDVRRMLRAGADKVSLNTAAVNDPEIVREAPAEFGNQCIVVAIDARRRNADDPGRGLGGRDPRRPHRRRRSTRSSGPCTAVISARARSCSPRWTATAPRSATTSICCAPSARPCRVPVIASGGVGTLEHLCQGATEGGATGLLAASIFHFGQHTVREAKAALAARGRHRPPVVRPCIARSTGSNADVTGRWFHAGGDLGYGDRTECRARRLARSEGVPCPRHTF